MSMIDTGQLKSWSLPAALLLVVAVWMASGLIGGDDEADRPVLTAPATDVLPAVRVRTQKAEAVQRTIVVNGQTAPSRTVGLSAETDGRVAAIGAERGAQIDRGAVIVRLDERDRRARLRQAEAMLKQREVEYQARERLKGESYVSEAQLQEALAALEAARTELTRARLDLDYMTIRAPFAGALQSRVVEVGDFVKSGDPVATVVDNRTLVVSANVSEFDAGNVRVGDAAEALLATGERVQGRIRYVAPVADEATRTFDVELEIDNANGRLRAGGTAELMLSAGTVLAHRVSPALLTLDDSGNVGIKLVNDRGEVEFREADVALSSNDAVWLAGLPETATIITVGQGFVTAGSDVDAVPESAADTAVAVKDDTDD